MKKIKFFSFFICLVFSFLAKASLPHLATKESYYWGKTDLLMFPPPPTPFQMNKDSLFYDSPVKFKEKVTEENFKTVGNWCDQLEANWAPGKAKCRLLAVHDNALYLYLEVLGPIKKTDIKPFSLKKGFPFSLKLNSELKFLYNDLEESWLRAFASKTVIELMRQDKNGAYYTAFEDPLLNEKAYHLHRLSSRDKSHIMRILLHGKNEEERDAASRLLWFMGLTREDTSRLIKVLTSNQREVENNVARFLLSLPDNFIGIELQVPLFKACIKMSQGNDYPVLIKSLLLINSLLEKNRSLITYIDKDTELFIRYLASHIELPQMKEVTNKIVSHLEQNKLRWTTF